MSRKMITAYRSMMMSFIKNNREYKTIDELNTNVNVISLNKSIYINRKNILEELNSIVKKRIIYKSYIKIPEYIHNNTK